MTRDSFAKPLVMTAAVLAALLAPAVTSGGQQLELIAPIPSETLQYRADGFVVFFSPAIGEIGLEGIRLSVTNTSGTATAIDWRECYFVLPGGGRSDAITNDIPGSFQLSPTQISIRQTVEIVAVPLCNVSHSESGWAIDAIEPAADSEIVLHLAVEPAAGAAAEGYDFRFRISPSVDEAPTVLDGRLPTWSALVALGVGFLLGLLLAVP